MDSMDHHHKEKKSIITFRKIFTFDQIRYAQLQSYNRAMDIIQDYNEHSYVQKKDKAFVLFVSGKMHIDYERLVEVYVDDFWRKYS